MLTEMLSMIFLFALGHPNGVRLRPSQWMGDKREAAMQRA
jgi:hypothetical protein